METPQETRISEVEIACTERAPGVEGEIVSGDSDVLNVPSKETEELPELSLDLTRK